MSKKRPATIPKILLTPYGEDHWPASRLYAVRTRPHLIIVRLDVSPSGAVTATRWPLIVPDLTSERLQTETLKLISILSQEMEVYEDLSGIRIDYAEPPPILHLAEPAHDNEYLLLPSAPRLYRIHLDRNGDETGFTHLPGWGAPFSGEDDPLAEMRAAAAFLRTHYGLRNLLDPDDT